VLYELLTGRPPHEGRSPEEILARVKEGLPWPPSAVARRVPAALEGICLQALDPDPAYRYRGAAELARDVECWLAGERVAADPQPLRTGVFRWVRRNPVTTLLAVLLVPLVAGLVVCAVVIAFQRRQLHEVVAAGARLQEDQEKQVGAALRREAEYVAQVNRQRYYSAQEFEEAVGALTALLSRLHIDDPAATAALKRELLGRAQRLAGLVDQAGASDRLAAGDHLQLAELFLQLGEAEEARRRCERAVGLTRPAARAQPENPQAQHDLLAAAEKLALADDRLDQLGAARDAYRLALSAAQAWARLTPQDFQARRAVAVCYERVGLLSTRLHDWPAAREAYGGMQAAVEAYPEGTGDPLERRLELANVLLRRAEVEKADNQAQEALAWYGRAIDIVGRLEKEGKLQGRPQVVAQRKVVEQKAEECREILRAVDDLAFALAQPPDKAERLLIARAAVLTRRGRPADAAATAEKLRALKPHDGGNLYNVACCLALCVPAVAAGKPPEALDDSEKEARAAYAAKALAALQEAVAHGFKDLSLLEIDPDLAALRPSAGYRGVVEEVKARRAWLTFPGLP
jgi:tetratricopeptide (TPR) repeat protein